MKNAPRPLLDVLLVAVVLSSVVWAVAQTPGSPTAAGAQEQLVSLSMIVTDKSNHFMDDVDRNELQVFEDGKPQELVSLTKETKPVRYAIAIDNSFSLRNLLAPSLEACELLISNNGVDDETALIRFISSDKIDSVQDFTADKARLVDTLKKLYLEGGKSAVTDAVYLAVESVASYKPGAFAGRRAVVLVSDGEDRSNIHKLDQLINLLRENGVQVFAIGITADLESEGGLTALSPKQKAEKFLSRLALETGGRAFFPKDEHELQAAAEEVAHDLRTQFTISYRQPASQHKGFHKVEVKIVGKKKLHAITRAGYLAP